MARLEVENCDLRRRLGDVEAHLGLSTAPLFFVCEFVISYLESIFASKKLFGCSRLKHGSSRPSDLIRVLALDAAVLL